MSRERLTVLLLSILSLAFVCSLCGCEKAPAEAKRPEAPAIIEAAPSPAGHTETTSMVLPPPASSPTKLMPGPAPKADEIQEAVARVFKAVATPALTSPTNFVVGDFNGDGSEDLAVAVSGSDFGEINNEFANWTLEDPKQVLMPGREGDSQAVARRAQFEKGDTLLAIIHGVGPQGWRNPDARQTFLLKNGVGMGMEFQPARALRNRKQSGRVPPIIGDVIQQTIDGKSGLIFWTGAKYAWY